MGCQTSSAPSDRVSGGSIAIPSARKEFADGRGNLRGMCLEREVTRIDEAHDGVGHVAFEGLGTPRQKERIVFTPDRQKGRLVRAEVRLELRIERDICLVIAEQVELQ